MTKGGYREGGREGRSDGGAEGWRDGGREGRIDEGREGGRDGRRKVGVRELVYVKVVDVSSGVII